MEGSLLNINYPANGVQLTVIKTRSSDGIKDIIKYSMNRTILSLKKYIESFNINNSIIKYSQLTIKIVLRYASWIQMVWDHEVIIILYYTTLTGTLLLLLLQVLYNSKISIRCTVYTVYRNLAVVIGIHSFYYITRVTTDHTSFFCEIFRFWDCIPLAPQTSNGTFLSRFWKGGPFLSHFLAIYRHF